MRPFCITEAIGIWKEGFVGLASLPLLAEIVSLSRLGIMVNVILGPTFKIQILAAITDHLDHGRECGKGDIRSMAVKGTVDQQTREEITGFHSLDVWFHTQRRNQKPLLRNASSIWFVEDDDGNNQCLCP